MTILDEGKLSKKYQVVIPTAVRKVLGLKAGDVVQYKLEGKKVVLEKAP